MAWGRPEPTFEEQFGMSREEFDAKLREGAEAKAKLTEIETQLSSGFEEMRNSISSLRAPAPTPPPSQDEPRQPANFFENPDQAFNDRMAPVANYAAETKARLEYMEAKDLYRREFQLWGAEIRDMIDKEQNLHFKTMPMFYENVVNIVRGKHAKEIEEAAAKGQSLFTEPASGGMPGGHHEDPKAAAIAKLTPEQLQSAKRFGMTPAEFADNLSYVESSYGHTKGSQHVN